jgi:hypothetical protein
MRAAAPRKAVSSTLKHWRKVKRHVDNPRVVDTLVREFNKFTYGHWGNRFTTGQYPFEFENCYWYDHHRGRRPQFWNYAKMEACHWLVNFNLELAQLVEPGRVWRIITSDEHSTVWDGHDTLFDFNFLAFGIPPKECFDLAYKHKLKPSQHLRNAYPNHWSRARARAQRANGTPHLPQLRLYLAHCQTTERQEAVDRNRPAGRVIWSVKGDKGKQWPRSPRVALRTFYSFPVTALLRRVTQAAAISHRTMLP